MMRIFLFGLCLAFVACSPVIFEESNCANQVMSEMTSPSGQYVATLIRRDCGATSAYANLVFLKRLGDVKAGNEVWGEKIYVSQGDMTIALSWTSAGLNIRAPATGSSIFLRRDDWAGVNIVYD